VARRGMGPKPRREPDSSLFPFLSVLACVIGTLTLLIAALAIGQVAESLLDAEANPDHAAVLEAERAVLRASQATLADAERVAEELDAAAAELRALGVQPDQSESARKRAVEKRRSAAQLAKLVRRLEKESNQLDGTIHGVEIELVSDKSSDENRPIRILPHGSARPLQPFFVECRAEGVRVYQKNLRDSLYYARESLDDVSRFRAFLQRVRSVREGTVIFLIRPDGVDSYIWASGQSGRLYVRHAKLPLPGQGDLEFAL
jgi:hypothetical protein